jgi:hypothetical protein
MELRSRKRLSHIDSVNSLNPILFLTSDSVNNNVSRDFILDSSQKGGYFTGFSVQSINKRLDINGVFSENQAQSVRTLMGSTDLSIFLVVAIPDLSLDHKIFSNNPISSSNTGFIISVINSSVYLEWQASGWRSYVNTFFITTGNNNFFLYEVHYIGTNTIVCGINGNTVTITSPQPFQLQSSNAIRLGNNNKITGIKDVVVFRENMLINPNYSNLQGRLMNRIFA